MRTIDGWVRGSYRLPGIQETPMLVYDYQALGRVDLYLVHEWRQIKDMLDTPDGSLAFNFHCSIAQLWLLSGYEIVRHIDKLQKTKQTEEIHQLFRRIRVPLVKFQKVKDRNIDRYPDDFDRPLLARSLDNELGWAVDQDTIITRDELAQRLYDLHL